MTARRALLAWTLLLGASLAQAEPPGPVCSNGSCQMRGPAYQQLSRYSGTLPGATPPDGAPPAGDATDAPSGGTTLGSRVMRARGGCATCPGAGGAGIPPSPAGFQATGGGGGMAAKGGCKGGSCAVRGGGILQMIGSFFSSLFGGR